MSGHTSAEVAGETQTQPGGHAGGPATVVLAQESKGLYPPGATNINSFNLFNAISWQITLGAPAILYAKSQGASATILGIIASLTPLLVILQIPAAHWLPKYGYRRFILAGWGSRTICIFALAAIPLLSFASPGWKLALVLLSLFAFNLLRGATSGAWMPWIVELIPAPVRGRFLSRDQLFCQTGCLISLLVSAAVLAGHPRPWQFALVFLLSAIGQTASLWFLTRVPDTSTPEQFKKSGHRVPWLQMLLYGPFLRLVILNLLYAAAVAGLGVFTVAFLKGVAGYEESTILLFNTLSVVGALLTVPMAGRILDRTGSKPVLRSCLLAFLLALAGWWLVASTVLGAGPLVIMALSLAAGVAGVNFGVASSRLAMATMPAMGRNHFCALYTVIISVGQGLSPIIWGVLLDAIGTRQLLHGPVSWNRYSIYFATAMTLALVTLGYTIHLQEGKATR